MSHGPGSGSAASGSSHLELLGRARQLAGHARALQDASDSDRVDDLHDELCALRNALVAHVHDEERELRRLSPAARQAIADGQRRLLHQVDAIMSHAVAGGADCDCVGRSAQLVSALATQARVEAGVLARHARRTRSTSEGDRSRGRG